MSRQTPKQQSLCNNKFDGLMNAAPHKRYKSFAVTVADGNRSGWTATRISRCRRRA